MPSSAIGQAPNFSTSSPGFTIFSRKTLRCSRNHLRNWRLHPKSKTSLPASPVRSRYRRRCRGRSGVVHRRGGHAGRCQDSFMAVAVPRGIGPMCVRDLVCRGSRPAPSGGAQVGDLYRKVYSLSNLERAWAIVRERGLQSGSRVVRADTKRFEAAGSRSIRSIQGKLFSKSFAFDPAKGVAIPRGPTKKHRPIVVASVASALFSEPSMMFLWRYPLSPRCVASQRA
jgi:hypothetical protein